MLRKASHLEWTELHQDMIQCWAHVNAVIEFRAPKKKKKKRNISLLAVELPTTFLLYSVISC
jgi:hypothetical protein